MASPTAEQLAEWRRLADAATPGPWRQDTTRVCDGNCGEPFEYRDGSATGLIERHGRCASVAISDMESLADAAFIAAARTAVPALLDEVQLLRAWATRLIGALKDIEIEAVGALEFDPEAP